MSPSFLKQFKILIKNYSFLNFFKVGLDTRKIVVILKQVMCNPLLKLQRFQVAENIDKPVCEVKNEQCLKGAN